MNESGREVPLPMFPLGTVLFPHMFLPLQVFEPRYRALTSDCLAGDREFGVVLIERGSEVGGGDQRSAFGTVASIIDVHDLGDGRLGLFALGTTRVAVVDWRADEPYPRAIVEPRTEHDWTPNADTSLASAERVVRRSLALRAELDEAVPPAHVELARDPVARSWQLAAMSPLGPFDRQGVLVIDDHAERLDLLTQLTEDACSVLAHRLSGG